MDYEIRNDKLLREAYQAGRQQALNELAPMGRNYTQPIGPGAAQAGVQQQNRSAHGGSGVVPTFLVAPHDPKNIPDYLLPYYIPGVPGESRPRWNTDPADLDGDGQVTWEEWNEFKRFLRSNASTG